MSRAQHLNALLILLKSQLPGGLHLVCAIYEVITGRPPHHELRSSDDPYGQVERLYTENCFPDVTLLPLGRLMQSCWHGNLNSMSEIIEELEAFPIPP